MLLYSKEKGNQHVHSYNVMYAKLRSLKRGQTNALPDG